MSQLTREERRPALATDYDGTLASGGLVADSTIDALRRFNAAAGVLLLVTGRQVADLQRIFPGLDLFRMVIAENGAVLHRPATGRQRLVADPPPRALVERLLELGVPVDMGQVIVATQRAYEPAVRRAMAELGWTGRVIYNRDGLMVLPPGGGKAQGLQAACLEFGLSPLDVVGIGDAENDLDFLTICGRSFAVANALPAVKAAVDDITASPNGQGVVEVIDRLLSGKPR